MDHLDRHFAGNMNLLKSSFKSSQSLNLFELFGDIFICVITPVSRSTRPFIIYIFLFFRHPRIGVL